MISVVIASYNGEKYIKDQIESILNQTVPIQELIVCDDCSTDRTVDIVKSIMESCHTVEIRLLQNENNQGYIRNFYKGISESRGEYIFLSDQDDIWIPEKVERMIHEMKTLNAELLCTNFQMINSTGEMIEKGYIVPDYIANAAEGVSEVTLDTLIYGNVAQGCTYCFSKRVKDIYLRIKCFNVIHDYQLILIAAALNGAYFLNEKLIKYRLHGNNSVGFRKKRDLSNVEFRLPKARPKVSAIIEGVREDLPVLKYYKYQTILYLRLPVLKAVMRCYFKKN